MIKFLKGKFHPCSAGTIIVETGSGMGLEVFVPMNSFIHKNMEDDDIKVYTEMVVKEDSMTLYGFEDKESLEVFRLLITVNGVGPKAAMSIMSTLTMSDLALAIAGGDSKTISSAPGIGKKTSDRIILELGDKMGKLNMSFVHEGVITKDFDNKVADSALGEALEGLIALGYNRAEAMEALEKVKGNCYSPEEYIRKALGQLL
ncbi:Holliday junction branch migration protein RuvA [Eubacteriales bacterium KG127]